MNQDIVALRNRLDRMEEQIRVLSERAGVPYDDGTEGIPPEVVDLVQSGNKLGAIRRYSEITGTDLGTAKQVVDTL